MHNFVMIHIFHAIFGDPAYRLLVLGEAEGGDVSGARGCYPTATR